MYSLPTLPYSYDALEPYIDTRTMEIHYTKHHQAYIDNLNFALQKHPELFEKPLGDLLKNLSALPADIRETVRNNGGGHLNHSLFWTMMAPVKGADKGRQPRGKVGQLIKKAFGSFEQSKQELSSAAKNRFGSGWAWLVLDKAGNLAIVSTPNQDTPISVQQAPLLGLDVWEHAYYLKYQNKRVDYIDAWWHVVNWDQVEENYTLLVG
jgi:superoxide dismutase, Fe-Mn family